MKTGPRPRFLAVLLALAMVGAACSSRDDDDSAQTETGDGGAAAESSINTDDCVSDPTQEIEGDVITLASSFPQSGLTAAFSEVARGWEAYLEKVNADGGVEIGDRTFTFEFKDMDDQYNAAETATNVEELVGQDGGGAFAVFSVIGTANNIAIRDFLGELCVPDVFAATGSPAWGNPDFPWLIGSTLAPYSLEGYMFAEVLNEQQPDAKVAMLVQDDDFGRAYEEGFRQAIEGTDIEVVEVQKYPTGASEVSAQITALAASGADAFFNGGTLLACPDALTKAAAANWTPITYVSATCASKTLMGLAGAAGDGVYTAANLKDPLNPEWDEDPAMQEYLDTVQQYRGDGFDPENAIVAYGYTQAAVFVEALKAAEGPTRLAVMESVRNLDGISDVGLLLPDVSVTTAGEDDPYMGESLLLAQYEFAGEGQRNHFVPQGELVDFEGQTLELTPEDLVTG
ncbi:MAG TPA: ABC transporter substrate-binding protein [Acidimicrobiales bacterium]|nr:ABC transporter substrate-binding protein [Acidimicrobiales bacterium]